MASHSTSEDKQPATKGDVKEAITELRTEMDTKFDAVLDRVAESEQRILDQFNVVAENIHKDVAGANADEISLIKDQKIPQLEKRVTALEQKV